MITATGYSKAQALAERDRLERLGLQPIDPEGNGYVIEGKTFMVKVRATESHEAAYHIMNIVGTPSIPEVLIVRLFTKAIAVLASASPARPGPRLAWPGRERRCSHGSNQRTSWRGERRSSTPRSRTTWCS